MPLPTQTAIANTQHNLDYKGTPLGVGNKVEVLHLANRKQPTVVAIGKVASLNEDGKAPWGGTQEVIVFDILYSVFAAVCLPMHARLGMGRGIYVCMR
jgi:hypothetical protein